MTAVPPRPAAPPECTCCPPGRRPAIEHAKGCPKRAPRNVPLSTLSAADLLAPDVSTDTGALREALRQELDDAMLMHTGRSVGDIASGHVADDLLALPALRDLIAERDELAAKVERVRELHAPEKRSYSDDVCDSCIGAYEENMPWPCPTIEALDPT